MESKIINFSIEDFKSRIHETPYFHSWHEEDSWNEEVHKSLTNDGVIDYEGLNEHEKMFLYIIAWNLNDFCPNRITIMRKFGWTSYKVGKMFKEMKPYGLESVAVFNERNGLLAGRGYQIIYHL